MICSEVRLSLNKKTTMGVLVVTSLNTVMVAWLLT